jgi:hypothetical protein
MQVIDNRTLKIQNDTEPFSLPGAERLFFVVISEK